MHKARLSGLLTITIALSCILFFPMFSFSKEKEKMVEHVDSTVPEIIGPFTIAISDSERRYLTIFLERRWWDLWSDDGRHLVEDHRYGIRKIMIEHQQKTEANQSFERRCYTIGGITQKIMKSYVTKQSYGNKGIPKEKDIFDITDIDGDGHKDFRLLCSSSKFWKIYDAYIYDPSSRMFIYKEQRQ